MCIRDRTYVDQVFPEIQYFFKSGLHQHAVYALLKEAPSPKEIAPTGAAYFTIGSAFFAHAFGGDIADQINTVCDYMEAPHA